MRYQRGLTQLAPPWLQGGFLEALGEALDALDAWAVAARNARYPLLAPADALPVLGWARRLFRHPTEPEGVYRRRLANAFLIWRWAGTEKGVGDVLRLAGFPYAQVFTLRWPCPCSRWSEVDVFVDGRPLYPGEGPALFSMLRAMMPAHAHLRGVYYGTPEYWQDDGIWEDDGVYWGGAERIGGAG